MELLDNQAIDLKLESSLLQWLFQRYNRDYNVLSLVQLKYDL